MTLDGYPSGASSLTLHEAQGDTVFTLNETSCGGAPCLRLEIGRSSFDGAQDRQRGFVVRLLTDQPTRVTLDGRALTPAASFPAWEMTDSGWFYDSAIGRVWAKFSAKGAPAILTVVR